MLTVTPTGAALGADIEGIDLRRIDDATFAKILDAWHDHLVIRFRGQQLDDDALAEFSRRFGVLDMAPTGRGGTPFNQSRPEITVLSNIVVDGAFKGALGNSELVWHQDMSYNDEPPKASLLYALEVPGEGEDSDAAALSNEPKVLGQDPITKRSVSLRRGPYGPYVQIDAPEETADEEAKRMAAYDAEIEEWKEAKKVAKKVAKKAGEKAPKKPPKPKPPAPKRQGLPQGLTVGEVTLE